MILNVQYKAKLKFSLLLIMNVDDLSFLIMTVMYLSGKPTFSIKENFAVNFQD